MPHLIRLLVVPALLGVSFGLLPGCSTVPYSNRAQFMFISQDQEIALGLQAYQEVLANEKLSNDARLKGILQRVGERIAAQSERPDFAWEFNLIESDQINAFALPGGKIAVYTGILPIMKNEAGMAAVLGHEIAHAVARHGGERISHSLTLAGITAILSEGLKGSENRDVTLGALGLGANVGLLLPFSRKHETEADMIGLKFAAEAGYDPEESVRLWQRMKEASGDKPPEFLSTHPSEERRIAKLRKYMYKAQALYEQAAQKYGLGEDL